MFSLLKPQYRGRVVLGLQLIALALAFFALPIARYFMDADLIEVTASASYSEDLDATMAIDGNVETEWCLPDASLGWIDVTFHRKRAVNAVWLTNGHNRGYRDRAITKGRIVLYDGAREVERHELELPGIEPEYKRRRIELSGRRGTRVRLDVVAFATHGGCLSEISVE